MNKEDLCDGEDYHNEFLTELAGQLLQDRQAKRVSVKPLKHCDYHDHEDGEHCYYEESS